MLAPPWQPTRTNTQQHFLAPLSLRSAALRSAPSGCTTLSTHNCTTLAFAPLQRTTHYTQQQSATLSGTTLRTPPHCTTYTALRCAALRLCVCVHVSTHQPTERVTVRTHALANFTGHGTVSRGAAPPCCAARALAITLHTLRPPQQACTPHL